jgi:serine/threonine-protein kinase HipA
MAMAVRGKNRHYRWKEIAARHWLETARRCGFSEMKSIMDEVIAQTPTVVEQASARLPRRFPASIAETIMTGTKNAARLLAGQMAHSGRT